MNRIDKIRILECVLMSFDVNDLELNKYFNFKEIEKAKEILEIIND